MNSFFRPFLAFALAIVLAVTSVALASARGRIADSEGQVLVLCSGDGLVQVRLGPDGEPTGESRLCPELVLGLISAFTVESLLVSPASLARPITFEVAVFDVSGRARPDQSARDPPVSV